MHLGRGGEDAVAVIGVLEPDQITMLRQVLSEYCAERGEADPAFALQAAERIMSLFASGIHCPEALAEALRSGHPPARLAA